MNLEFVKQWEENKHLLEEWFKNTPCDYEYQKIVEKLFELVLKPLDGYRSEFDVEEITTIDNGDYQGTQIFLIPYECYQPSESEYVVTYQSYGSCSGCDSLLSISVYSGDKPNEQQIKDLMSLALHLMQNAKPLY